MNKCKLGLDPNIVDLAAIGVVKSISRRPIKRFSKIKFLDREALFYPEGTEETRYSISGIINKDIASNIEKLLNLHNAQETVWLEQDEFVVGGVIDSLAFDYDEGFERTRYRIGFHEEPFWGRTLAQEYITKKTYLADLDFAKKLWEIFPTMAKHNFILDRANKKFVWEFILVNELEETPSFSPQWDDNQSSFWSIITGGTGILGTAILTDVTSPLKRGANALKLELPSGAYDFVHIFHTYSPTLDWSGYDFIAFWWYGANSGQEIVFEILAPDDPNRWGFGFVDNFSGWRRIVFPLRKPGVTHGSPSLSTVGGVRFNFWSAAHSPATWYLDRGGVDVGSWAKVEIQIPDYVSTNPDAYPTVDIFSWDVNTNIWSKFLFWDGVNTITSDNRLFFLDGTKQLKIMGSTEGWHSYGLRCYWDGFRGETKSKRWSSGTEALDITYSKTYGCKHRVGFAIKMPPWTGVDDLSGKFAINKAKLKIEVFWEDEKTTMIKGGEV